MNILSASYTNIWPFTDQTVAINFRDGSHLIQAPIGSGKSFLFFDGPLFGLYKYRNRPILNKQATSWAVQILFEAEGQTRLIQRALKPTKKWGESIKTKLWSVQLPDDWLTARAKDTPLLSKQGKKLTDILPAWSMDEIEFTSSSEGDQAILDLLPPREVTLSINFLMQESISVFELTPAERIQVFKHLFGLLGIDEAKDKINEHRRELQAKINVTWDLTSHNHKLQQYLTTAQHTYQQLQASSTTITALTLPSQTPFFSDLLLMWEKVQDATCDGFSIQSEDYAWIIWYTQEIEMHISSLTKLQGERAQIQQQLEQLDQSSRHIAQENDLIAKEIIQIETVRSDEKAGSWKDISKDIDTKRSALQKQIETLESSIPRDAFKAYGTSIEQSSQLDETISLLLQEGKSLKQQLENCTLRNQQLISKEQDYTTRTQELDKQMESLQASYEQQNLFHCDKIEGNCPYIDLINTSASTALTKQKEHLLWQQKKLTEQYTSLSVQQKKQEIQKEQTSLEQQIHTLKSFLTDIDRKSLQDLSVQIKTKKEEKRELDQQREKQLIEQQRLQKQREQYIKLQEKKHHLDEQYQKIETQKAEITKHLEKKNEQELPQQIKDLQNNKLISETLHQICQKIDHLLDEVTEQQKKIKTLKEKLVITKDLYQIFSKELMTVVLQDFLPTLQEVLNSYLWQIVDYQIKFLSPSDNGEWSTSQLELDIQVIDEKWARSVKSLSGWQKTVLKLVWMLWVATLFRSKFLLLDETINNLDIHTISQVAEVLEDFVASQQIKFYVVTHSPQIQEMDIWESVVRVK